MGSLIGSTSPRNPYQRPQQCAERGKCNDRYYDSVLKAFGFLRGIRRTAIAHETSRQCERDGRHHGDEVRHSAKLIQYWRLQRRIRWVYSAGEATVNLWCLRFATFDRPRARAVSIASRRASDPPWQKLDHR